MTEYIIKRLLFLIPVLFLVSIITFLLIHMSPGDPAATILGETATEEMIADLREKLGLNLPLYQQYLNWIVGVLQGDLGNSFFMDKPVTEAIFEQLKATISLATLAQIFSIVIAIPLGIIAATKQGTRVDQMFMTTALLGISVPSFLLGLFLILIFAVQLNWLPVGGYVPLSNGLWNHLKYLILPAISLGAMQAALIARMTRTSMLDTFNVNYIKTARSKGLKETIVVFKHALRNAFIPILTIIGQTFGTLVAGAVVTETIFNIPGIGQLIIHSVERRDYAVIQGAVLLIATSYVFINLIVDLLYGVIDPRVRLSQK